MKLHQTAETQCGCSSNAVRWGRAVGCGLALGTLLGTVVGVAMKNALFVYVGMCLGAAIGGVFKSRQTKTD